MSADAHMSDTSWASPADAHRTMLALLHDTVVEVARRRQDDLPGLVESLQDDVVLTAGGTSRAVHGWFAEGVWRYGDRRVHEMFLNAARQAAQPTSEAEEVLVTLLHEACHVWAQLCGIRDTSRDGRYHNRRFAEIALTIGLAVQKDRQIGHDTPGLSSWARAEYGDLLAELERGLVLVREPRPSRLAGPADQEAGGSAVTTVPGPTTSSSKYVFASCRCLDARRHRVTIRAAKGSWRPGVITCSICQTPFKESLDFPESDGSTS